MTLSVAIRACRTASYNVQLRERPSVRLRLAKVRGRLDGANTPYDALPEGCQRRRFVLPWDITYPLIILPGFSLIEHYRSDGVTLMGFDSFLQITLVVETLSC